MKRFLILLSLLFLFGSLSFAGVWSSLSSSGIDSAYSSLNSFVTSKNNEIKQFWETNIQTLLEEINKESQEKEKSLKELRALQKELLLNKKEINFLLKQHNELLSAKANVNAL
ncbi:hypothetical protein [Helicobacter rodentium]|uniref:hypothetical protein n=1 Tax=Helicobacter rodentium TaxID=59617 RepID=UPI0023F4B9AA|nr:hypothetical protein [Helicobacter rodentium]